jgi:hypothetical protein
MHYFSRKFNTLPVFLGIAGVLLVPTVAFGAGEQLINIITMIERILGALFPIVTAAGILAFGYNVIRYLTSKDLADQNIYKSGLLNSLFALFIFFTVVGIVTIIARSFGIPTLGQDIGIANQSGSGSGTGAIATFRGIALTVAKFISIRIIPIMIASALLFFLGNIVISMTKSDVEAERTKMNDYLKWGVLGIFILLTFFSIVSLFTGSLFGVRAVIPQFQTQPR